MKKSLFLIVALTLFAGLVLSGCASKDDGPIKGYKTLDPSLPVYALGETEEPIVTIEMEDGSIMKLELYPAVAPNTVNNFIYLANNGFYDGLIFHRVIDGFMIQGGDPDGNGGGGPGYSIEGEFAQNGFENNLSHEKGVISMARQSINMNSAGSQFFIMSKTNPNLDGGYAAFGKLIEGYDTLDVISRTQTDADDRPVNDQVIKSITVETFDVYYPAPNTVK